MVLVGAILLLLGIATESLYITSSRVAYNGLTLSTNTYLVSGIIAIFLGFILTWTGVKIPKVRIS